MPLLNLSVKHGQPPDVARANFVQGINEAQSKFAIWIQRVEWAPDRHSAKLHAPGFVVEMSVDDQEVHATGDVPFFAMLMQNRVKTYLKDTFQKQLPS